MNELINFSDENILELNSTINKLCDIIVNAGFDVYVNLLIEINKSAKEKNEEKFNNLIINSSLFGGAGAMWEIWIENDNMRVKFEKEFCLFVDVIKKMGIKNSRIDQVRGILSKLNE